MRFWVTNDATTPDKAPNYNIELMARYTGDGVSSQFYAAKFVYIQLGRSVPTLLLIRESQINSDYTIDWASLIPGVDYIELTGSAAGSNCPSESANKCNGTPPLLSGIDRNVNYAVLQISAVWDTLNSETDLVAAVGWNCGSAGTGSVYKCSNVCCLAKSDSDPLRLDVNGRFAIFGHHPGTLYKLEWTRFGDTSAGTWP
jgi:hypothetical protein